MASIQSRLKSLQPHLMGIRYFDGVPVIDITLKNDWILPQNNRINTVKGDESLNYYMIISEIADIEMDELIDYVEHIIKINQEREKKHDLLKQRINDLKDLFKRTSLNELMSLKFVLNTINKSNDEEISLSDIDTPIDSLETSIETKPLEITNTLSIEQPILSQEEKEFYEEELRAERNRKLFPKNNNKNRLELTKKQPILEQETDRAYSSACECGEGEACDICIDYK